MLCAHIIDHIIKIVSGKKKFLPNSSYTIANLFISVNNTFELKKNNTYLESSVQSMQVVSSNGP